MSSALRWNHLIIAAVIIMAALIGLAVPLLSGEEVSLGARPTLIVLPSPSTPTLTVTPTETPMLSLLPTATSTATPTATVAASSTFTATAEITVTATVTFASAAQVASSMTPTVAVTQTAEVIPTAAVTLTIIATENVRVRQGPDVAYAILGTARSGDTFTVIGRNADGTWWQICCLPGERSGWVFGGLVTLSGDPMAVPVVNVPPPPTLTPSASS
ncbi:MAG: SH3 domain-containing protein [Anaerolineae bacterium]|nr:SH3 domain-containing protein [Anaerolineae bacterium]MDW8099347.1 SH3 domain-containing protein [Anaerolineae bacterium]